MQEGTGKMKTALVLSGGGARGAYHVGVAKALNDLNFPIHLVCGTSVGALNAAMIVQGDMKQLLDIWWDLDPRQVYTRNSKLKFLFSFQMHYVYPYFSSEPLAKLISDHIDPKRIQKSNQKLIITACNQTLRRIVRFTNDSEDLPSALLASSSIPIAFPPVSLNGFEFVDAGLMDNVPLKPAMEEGAEKIIVVIGSHSIDPPPPIKNNLEWVLWLIDIAQARNVLADIEMAKKINLSEDREEKGYKLVDLIVVAPSRRLDLNATDFHKRNAIREAIKMGYEDGMRAFNSRLRKGEVQLEDIMKATFKEEGGGRAKDLFYQGNQSG